MTRTEQLLGELIALPSVNPAFLPARHPHAGEHRVADFLASLGASAGLDVEFQAVDGPRRNVLLRLSPRGAVRHRLLLAPHLDTVNVASEAGFTPVKRSGRIHGRGACDTKGSAAAMFTALIDLARSRCRPHSTEIVFAGLVDEEYEQAGARALAAQGLRTDLAIVGEPTRCRVVTAHKGNVWVRLATRGRAAHGATPHFGRNAVHEMARIVDALETRYRADLRRRRHPLLGCPTSSVGVIRGGTQANIVPDHCMIELDRRTLPGETSAGIQGELRQLLKTIGCQGTFSLGKHVPCPALETDPRLPWVQQLLKTAGQRQTEGVHFFCDAAVLAGGGIPSVVFGPGDIAQAHTVDEWISASSLNRSVSILAKFFAGLP